MTPEEIAERLESEEFTPLRVVTSGGKHYDITRAELAVVAGATLFLFPVGRRGSHYSREQPTTIAIRNIAAIEPLPERAA